MEIGKDSKFKVTYKSETYYFCSKNCKDHFDRDPSKYVNK